MKKRELPLLRGIPPLAGIIQPRDGARWCWRREAGPMLAEDFDFIVTPEDLRLEEEESLLLFGPETLGTEAEWYDHSQRTGEETHASNDRHL